MDFSREDAQTYSGSSTSYSLDQKAWEARLRRVSALFAGDPRILTSDVSLSVEADNRFYTNSEGSQIAEGDVGCRIFIQAATKADDGMGLFALVGVPMALTAWRRSRVRVMLPDGRIVSVKHQTPAGAELEPDGEDSWSLRLTAEGNVSRATGTVATHGLRGLLTTVNFFGARTGEIDNAIGMLQQSGDANRYIAKVARAAQSTGTATPATRATASGPRSGSATSRTPSSSAGSTSSRSSCRWPRRRGCRWPASPTPGRSAIRR